MDRKEGKQRIETIYSRRKNHITTLLDSFKIGFSEFRHFPISSEKEEKGSITLNKVNSSKKSSYETTRKIRKVCKILIVLMIAFMVFRTILSAIEPIIDVECINMAKSIATRISNEQATIVMSQYQYDDLTNITRDENENIKLISTNIITVNQIISDIPVLIQKELEREENNKFYLKLGSFTGSEFFAGRGPDIEIKMKASGNVETNLKSEFSSAGINQTLHRIYLEVNCEVDILTPFHIRKEKIVNQVLLAEGVIMGEIPDTYYNLEGISKYQLLDPMN